MSLDKPYLDVPGTTIFDAEQSRKGYWLNQFCMSLMKADNRERFKADERAYLDEWPMSEEQKQAVLARDLNRCIAAGGNIYFLAKLGATRRQELPADGRQHDRHDRRGIPRHDDRRRPQRRRQPRARRGRQRAGAPPAAGQQPKTGWSSDHGHASPPASTPRTCRRSARRSTWARRHEPYWQKVFDGYEFSQAVVEGQPARRDASWSSTTTPPPSAWR